MTHRQCSGSCHCGAVRFKATIDHSKEAIRCSCSICKMARARFTFVIENAFRETRSSWVAGSTHWRFRRWTMLRPTS